MLREPIIQKEGHISFSKLHDMSGCLGICVGYQGDTRTLGTEKVLVRVGE